MCVNVYAHFYIHGVYVWNLKQVRDCQASGGVVKEDGTVFRLLHFALQQPFIFVFFIFPGLKMGNII